ncbi:MAG: Hpt domain-containing protein, partial [Rhodospirillales bacterium]|nr:Hpt domain-containing protein [Rhodospirillales bacterium]
MDDLLSEFLTETSESLAVLDVELVKMEQNPNDPAILSNIFRLVHTIKGTCGFLGLPRLEHVAHAAENVLGKFRDGDLEVTAEYVTLILSSIDCIKEILGHLEKTEAEPEGNDADLISRLNIAAEGKSLAGAPPKVSPPMPEFDPLPPPTFVVQAAAQAAPEPEPDEVDEPVHQATAPEPHHQETRSGVPAHSPPATVGGGNN